MIGKDLIQNEINRIGKARLIRSYCSMTAEKNESTIKTAFVRGSISKTLAFDLESLTQVSALFWMLPTMYKTSGERR